MAKSAPAQGDLVIGVAKNINNLDVLKQEYSSNFISVRRVLLVKYQVKEGIKLYKRIEVVNW
ncbi:MULTISPECIES: hypothetical protein [Snodgrassella]|uniref:hypothetical protein n=1 Tax=Snodgrassella TaxID=1193515 RepID=UPI00226AB799|nr:hypothetical protein [Snodgrassella sp. B3837]MCX8753255.1 hypothetical protein [Snodgrassella sp. B3837]